jgi:hypothetical protein
LIAELAGSNQCDVIENLHIIFKNCAGSMQRTYGFAERAQHDATWRMNVADRLNIGPRFVNSGVNPKFGIRATSAGELTTVDVELEQVIDLHKCRAHSWRKNEPVGARDAGAYVSERRRDALLVQNMAGSDDVLLDLFYIHRLYLPYVSHTQMSNSDGPLEGWRV